MTEKNKVFFAADGITATSANHLCNIGKEYVASAHSRLDNIRFITTTVETLKHIASDPSTTVKSSKHIASDLPTVVETPKHITSINFAMLVCFIFFCKVHYLLVILTVSLL